MRSSATAKRTTVVGRRRRRRRRGLIGSFMIDRERCRLANAPAKLRASQIIARAQPAQSKDRSSASAFVS
jgi:hypothetical protein